jgi:hypothetical protein
MSGIRSPLNKSQKLVTISKMPIGESNRPQVHDVGEVWKNNESEGARRAECGRDHTPGGHAGIRGRAIAGTGEACTSADVSTSITLAGYSVDWRRQFAAACGQDIPGSFRRIALNNQTVVDTELSKHHVNR